MNAKIFRNLRSWFLDFTARYQFDNELDNINIKNKVQHSLRVCSNMEAIFKGTPNAPGNVHLAKIIGLLHDIGRFEQYKWYNTYRDDLSVNHAELSAKVLQLEGIIDEYDELRPHQKLILDAISQHNALSITESDNAWNNFYTKLIRDADKVDIIRIALDGFTGDGEEEKKVIKKLNFKDSEEISDQVFQDFCDEKVIRVKDVKSINDYKVLILSWIFDLNFSATREIIYKREYFDKILRSLPLHERAALIAGKVETIKQQEQLQRVAS